MTNEFFLHKLWNDITNPVSIELIVERGIKILIILVVLTLIWVVVRHLLRQILTPGRGLGRLDAVDDQRVITLRGFINNIVRVVLVLIGLMMGLREIGIDTTSLLAGVSVMGLAIGVGAQSMVRDYFAGILIVIENQFNVGDKVEMVFSSGPTVIGTVEKIEIRSTLVRGTDGKLNFIGNGSILRVSNGSRDWSMAIVEMVKPVNWLAERVRVEAQIVCDLLMKSEVKDLILSPAQVFAVTEVDANGINSVEIRCKTLPGQQIAVENKLRVLIARQIEGNKQ